MSLFHAMHKSLYGSLAACVLAASAAAQCVSPGPQTFQTLFVGTTFLGAPDPVYGGNAYFDMTFSTSVTITGFAANMLDDGGIAGNPVLTGQIGEIELWARMPAPSAFAGNTAVGNGGTVPATPPGWTSLGRVQVTIQPSDTPSGGTLAVPVTLPAGTYGMALNYLQVVAGQPNAGAPLHPLYTNPNVVPTPLTISDQFVSFTAGQTQGVAWTGGVVSPRIANMQLDYLVGPNTAYTTKYGAGCYDRNRIFYESFLAPGQPATTAPDIATGGNNGLDLIDLGGSRYFVQVNNTPGLAQTPNNTVGAAVGFPIHVNGSAPGVSGSATQPWDDAVSTPITIPFNFTYPGGPVGGTSQIVVSSNGLVYLNGTATRTFGFYDDTFTFSAGDPAIAALWTDLEPLDASTLTGGVGDIYVDADAANTFVAITWVGVREWTSPVVVPDNLNTFQIVLQNGGGAMIRYNGVAISDAPFMVGFSPGGGVDPGTGVTPEQHPDFTAATPYLSGDGAKPAIIGMPNRPKVGNNAVVRTTNLDAGTVQVFTFVSFGSFPGGITPPIGVWNPPGCNLYVTLPQDFLGVGVPVGGAVAADFGPIPASALGWTAYAQSAQVSGSLPLLNDPLGAGFSLLLSDAVCIHIDAN